MKSSGNDIFYNYSIIYGFCFFYSVLYAQHWKKPVIFIL